MMNVLAIDTSTELATVALLTAGDVLSKEQGSMRQHAQCLLPMIDDVLQTAGVSFKQLDGIAFGRGPGSFTGLRIACSVAKGLAYAHDLPLYPVSGLAAIAYQVVDTEQRNASTLAIIDARMNQIYWGVFAQGDSDAEEHVTSASDVCVDGFNPVILAGTGLDIYEQDLPHLLRSRIIQQDIVYPKAAAMIRLVEGGRVQPVSAADALPVYIRNQVTHGGMTGESNG
jgi:tRNA threonylcarbamoyladenosine biosynthesis protein TsaB